MQSMAREVVDENKYSPMDYIRMGKEVPPSVIEAVERRYKRLSVGNNSRDYDDGGGGKITPTGIKKQGGGFK